MVLKGCAYVGTSLCRLYTSSIFGMRALLVWVPATSCLNPLNRGLVLWYPEPPLWLLNESNSVRCSVVSDSLQPHGLEPTRLFRPWNSPGNNTTVSRCSLLQGIFPTQELNWVSCIAGRFFTSWVTREGLKMVRGAISFLHGCHRPLGADSDPQFFE